MRLGSQVLHVQGIHRAFEADVEFRDFVLCQRDQLGVGEIQRFPAAGDVLLVAADTVQRFGEDDVEAALAGIGQQSLQPRAVGCGAAERVVAVDLTDGPPLPLGAGAANPHLVID